MLDTKKTGTGEGRSPEELAAILKSLAMGEDFIPMSCTGKVNHPAGAILVFDYVTHHWHLQNKLELKNNLLFQNVLSTENAGYEISTEEFNDSVWLTEITEHYGHMDLNSPAFEVHFGTYKKFRLGEISRWIGNRVGLRAKLENKRQSLDAAEKKIVRIGNTLKECVEKNESFHAQSSLKTGVDFYKLPRPITSTREQELPEGNKLPENGQDTQAGNDLFRNDENSEKIQTYYANFPFVNKMDVGRPPKSVIEPTIKKQLLKKIVDEFPLGVTASKLRRRVRKLHGNNYLLLAASKSEFIDSCKEFTDVFYFSEMNEDMDKILLFPAVLARVMQPIHHILLDLWHLTKFLLNENGNKQCIFVEDIFPQIKEMFDVNFIVHNWGFHNDKKFILFLCQKISSECGYNVLFDTIAKKNILIFCNDTNEGLVRNMLELGIYRKLL